MKRLLVAIALILLIVIGSLAVKNIFILVRAETINYVQERIADYNARIAPDCHPLTGAQTQKIARAIVLMRQTDNGEQLYQMIKKHNICISSYTLKDAIAKAIPNFDHQKRWESGTIVFDPRFLDNSVSDRFVASILVHEATRHQDFIDGTSCYQSNTCILTTTHEALQEEKSAYRAESQWWIDMYGVQPGPPIIGNDNFPYDMAVAYISGPKSFNDWLVNQIGHVVTAK